MTQDDAIWMRRAIAVGRRGVEGGQTPFGSVVVRDGRLVAEAHNTVWADTDPTAHAEINNLRRAAAALGTIDLHGCTLYTTCEPCPMCLAAIHWSRITRVVYGASIADAAAAGFSELPIAATAMVEQGHSPLHVVSGVLREECLALIREWQAAKRSVAY